MLREVNPPQFIFTSLSLAIICWLPFRISSDHHQQLLNLIALQLVSSLSPANLSAICLLSRAHTDSNSNNWKRVREINRQIFRVQVSIQLAAVATVICLFVCLDLQKKQKKGKGKKG